RRSGVQLLHVPNPHGPVGLGGALPLGDVTVAGLLGRGGVSAEFDLVLPKFQGRRVLITGAAGSIGSELCRQIARLGAAELAILDTDETGLADLRNELRGDVAVRLLLCSITDP